jgi:hypothetical protein
MQTAFDQASFAEIDDALTFRRLDKARQLAFIYYRDAPSLSVEEAMMIIVAFGAGFSTSGIGQDLFYKRAWLELWNTKTRNLRFEDYETVVNYGLRLIDIYVERGEKAHTEIMFRKVMVFVPNSTSLKRRYESRLKQYAIRFGVRDTSQFSV